MFAPAGDLEFLCFDIGCFRLGFSNSVSTAVARKPTMKKRRRLLRSRSWISRPVPPFAIATVKAQSRRTDTGNDTLFCGLPLESGVTWTSYYVRAREVSNGKFERGLNRYKRAPARLSRLLSNRWLGHVNLRSRSPAFILS